ncbi:lipid kinase [soil metagenome]
MRILLLSNESSGSSDSQVVESIAQELSARGSVTSLVPSSREAFDEEVSQAARDVDLLVVAGGDGTINCTVNALRDDLGSVTFGLVPMGTGNDLARTLEVSRDPIDAARAVVSAPERSIDVWRTRGGGVDRLFINACMGGFPVEVNEAIDEDLKRKVGALAFVIGGAKGAADMTRYRVTIDGKVVDDCIAAGVGNGRTCGGGVRVWPQADPSDGLLDACVLSAEGIGDTLKLAATIRAGRHTALEEVETLRAEHIEISSEPAMEFNLDGELVELVTPVIFEGAGSIMMRV